MGPQLYELDWIWLILTTELVTRRFDTIYWDLDTRRKVHDIVRLKWKNGACFIRLFGSSKDSQCRPLACRYVG